MFNISTNKFIPNTLETILNEYEMCNIEEKENLDSLFSYTKLNHIDRPNVLSLSLFCKDINTITYNEPLSEEVIKKSIRYSDGRNKWELYFEKILKFGPEFIKNNPDKKIRIYLDPECYFIAEKLLEFSEVYVMDKTSISAQPGAMWRMLAFEDHNVDNVVCWDADNMHIYKKSYDLFNSQAPFGKIYNSVSTVVHNKLLVYRFLQCGLMSARIKIPILQYMKAFIYCANNNKLIKHTTTSYGQFEFFGNQWPFYGFDEWFCHNIIFPIIQEKGIDIFVERDVLYTLNEFMIHELQNNKNNFIII